MSKPKSGREELGEDGLVREIVQDWTKEKQGFLTRYVIASSGAAAKFPQRVFVDLMCGSGQARIKNTTCVLDGSVIAAAKAAKSSLKPFDLIIIADKDQARVDACQQRLAHAGFQKETRILVGEATETSVCCLQLVPSSALTLAFLDPYSLKPLPFKVIAALSRIRAIGMMVHLSRMDLLRNHDRNRIGELQAAEAFAPGWKDVVRHDDLDATRLSKFIEQWQVNLRGVGMGASQYREVPQWNPVYLLALISRKPLANKLWRTILPATDDIFRGH